MKMQYLCGAVCGDDGGRRCKNGDKWEERMREFDFLKRYETDNSHNGG